MNRWKKESIQEVAISLLGECPQATLDDNRHSWTEYGYTGKGSVPAGLVQAIANSYWDKVQGDKLLKVSPVIAFSAVYWSLKAGGVTSSINTLDACLAIVPPDGDTGMNIIAKMMWWKMGEITHEDLKPDWAELLQCGSMICDKYY